MFYHLLISLLIVMMSFIPPILFPTHRVLVIKSAICSFP